jgi:hypothetical protein
MKTPVGSYVNLTPQSSEMFSGYGERGERGQWKGGMDCFDKEIVQHFAAKFLRNILSFIQYLISPISDLLNRKCKCYIRSNNKPQVCRDISEKAVGNSHM